MPIPAGYQYINIDAAINPPTDFSTKQQTEMVRIVKYIKNFTSVLTQVTVPTLEDFKPPIATVIQDDKKERMKTLGKTEQEYYFRILWWITDNDKEHLRKKMREVAEALTKLFSNNAFGNLNGQFKGNSGFWYNSDILQCKFSGVIKTAQISNSQDNIMSVGDFRIVLYDLIVK